MHQMKTPKEVRETSSSFDNVDLEQHGPVPYPAVHRATRNETAGALGCNFHGRRFAADIDDTVQTDIRNSNAVRPLLTDEN